MGKLLFIWLSLFVGFSNAIAAQAQDRILNAQERLERAKAEAQRQIDSGLIQGAVFVATDIPVTALGLQCVKPEKKPMSVNSRFDMASVGKTFTAALCALLVCDGKLNPDDPFTKYLPEHVLGKDCDITVRDLAMHVGGFDNAKP